MEVDSQVESVAARPPVSSGLALAARGLTKRFPGVLAVDNIDFDVRAGEIVALLGQNGAGKSTLIQMLAGAYPHGSYSGDILLEGQSFRPRSVAEAERAGVALVPQEINVAPELSIAQTLFLNAELTRFGFVDLLAQKVKARQILEEFSLHIDADAPMGSLDLATQQLVIIARALSKSARVLILDEPTAALTHNEAQQLFRRLFELRARGVGIVFVSHRLAEVFEISDRIVVMRDSRVCGDFIASNATRDAVVKQMVGKAMQEAEQKAERTVGAAALSVEALAVWDPGRADKKLVQELSFALHRGEILGLFGLLGSGCIEAALAMYGAWPGESSGTLRVEDRALAINTPADAIAEGIGMVVQDRRDCLIAEESILGNSLLASLVHFSPYGVVDWLGFRQHALAISKRLNIKATSVDTLVGTLSGGNQQKVQIARWLASRVHVLLLVDPTRGVDVGARAEITRIWRELASQGYALLLVSTDAEEIVDVCDRALVLRNGKQVAELAHNALTEEGLLRAATGV